MGTTLTLGGRTRADAGRLIVAVAGLDTVPNASHVIRVLEEIPGVARAYVNPDTEMAYVEYSQAEVTPGKLLAAIEAEGFAIGDATANPQSAESYLSDGRERTAAPLQEIGPAEAAVEDGHSCCGHERSGGAPGADAATVGVEGTRTAIRSNKAGAQGTWPFKVRLGLFLAACVLVLGPALWLVRPMSSSAMAAEYNVDMSMTGFTPPNFSIPAGKPVSLQLNNVDSPFHGVINGALHQFAVDKLGIDVRIDGKQSTVITLPALEPGTYEFYCNVCCGGKVNPSMHGTITVQGAESAESAESAKSAESAESAGSAGSVEGVSQR
jgi:cytochrome c oxidase subunit II